jgi:RHS repeat-associated protein
LARRGQTTQNNPNACANPRQFVGEYLGGDGLYDLRARDYDNVTGRFLAEDPLVTPVAASLGNTYVNDRPTVLRDPSGLCGTSTQPTSVGQGLASYSASGSESKAGANAVPCSAYGTCSPNPYVEVQVAQRGDGVDANGSSFVSYEVFVRQHPSTNATPPVITWT